MTGLSLGPAMAMAREVPVGPTTGPSSTSARAGRAPGAGRARPPAPDRRRLRPARRRPDLRGVRRGARPRATGCASTPATSSTTRCRAPTCWSWGTSCTTGTWTRSGGCSPRRYDALPAGRGADRLRGDHRRRAARERLRPADEPEHAHRDAGRLRLHRRRLPGWMRRPASARRTSSTSSGRTRWSSASSRARATFRRCWNRARPRALRGKLSEVGVYLLTLTPSPPPPPPGGRGAGTRGRHNPGARPSSA